MNTEEPNTLAHRVTDLESEVRNLRKRVAALEGVEFVETAATPLAPQPLAPQPVVAPPPTPVAPPPIPARAFIAPAMPEPPRLPTPPPVPMHARAPSPVLAPKAIEPSVVSELLAALHLLPPSGRGSGEAQIGAWWATRIGALIAVIGVVFFGVYLSLGTPPWVKLLELAAIAGGVTLAGLWIERKVERLGSVIAGSGLALCFFTAFAAYAVPAVKVVESITAGALLQAVAVIGIAGAALWRRSSTVATMAVLLGFVSAFFSFSEGFDDFAVVAGIGLSAMAVFFRKREGWSVPLITSAALVHVVNALVAVEIWDTQAGQRSPWLMFAVVGAAFGLHLLSVMLEGGGEDGRIARAQRWIQAINSSLAVLTGLVVALVALPDDQLSWYFFGSGAVLTATAAGAWRVVPKDGLFGMFAVKASSLVALGVIAECDARTRWVALVVQAAVIMAAAARTGRISLAVTSVIAWMVSLLYFAEDIQTMSGQLVSPGGVAVALYILGGAALLAWVSGWLRSPERMKSAGTGVAWLLGAAAAVPVGLTLGMTWQEPWIVVACVGVSLALMLMARVMRSPVPVIGATVVMLAAHGVVQVFDEGQWGLLWLWAGAALVALRSGALAWLVGARDGEHREAWLLGSEVLVVLALAAIGGATMQSTAPSLALAVAVVIAVACAAAGVALARDDFVVAGLFGLPVAWALHVGHRPLVLEFAVDGTMWSWVSAAGAPIALAITGATAGKVRGSTLARGLAAATGILLVWAAAESNFGPLGLAWSLFVAAAVYLGIGRWRGCIVSQVAASALLALAVAYFVSDTDWASREGAWSLLVAVFILVMALAAVPLIQARGAEWLRPEVARPWRVVHAIVSLGCLLFVASITDAAWKSNGSVVWAVGGVVLFVLGLVFRARSHRLAGLIALGLCIPRVFMYDIQSTSHRIAAFVVLGVLILVVGFSYQRFRHLIEGTPEEWNDSGRGKDAGR